MSTSFLTRQRLALLGVLAAVMGLTGCQHLRNLGGSCHDTKPYMKATSIAPLKIPPGLDTPDSSNALKIPPGLDTPDSSNALKVPALNTPEPPRRGKKDPCLDAPPPFNVPKQAPPQA